MKFADVILYITLAVVIVGVGLALFGRVDAGAAQVISGTATAAGASAAPQQAPQQAASSLTQTTGSTAPEEVEVSLTPMMRDGKLVVAYASNTHSVDLSGVNLKEAVVLRTSSAEYHPISAPRLAGHHNNGEIVFDMVPDGAYSITISGIPPIQDRIYRWGE